MAKYTTELRRIVEQAEMDAHGEYTPYQYTSASFAAIGLDSYPIFDETYKAKLNSKIIDHFYMREIGAETAGLFKLFMRRTMNEIMSYYNQLYESEGMVDDPLSDRDWERTEGWGSEKNSISSSQTDSTSTTSDDSHSIYSDTPMDMLENMAEGPTVANLDYATNVTYDESQGTGTSKVEGQADSTSTDEGSRSIKETGRNRAQSELLSEWRDTFLNIDLRILDDLEVCFMTVYG